QVRWDYPEGTDSATQPPRLVPQLLGCEVLAQQARFYVPAGLRRSGPVPAPPGPEGQQLYELARAYQRLSAVLFAQEQDTLKPAVLLVQRHFFGALRHLEQSLSWQAAASTDEHIHSL